MKKLMIIGGISMMTAAGTNMIWHKQKLNDPNIFNPNTLAITSGGFFVTLGLTYRF
jgi:hypothetical protein